MPVRRRSRLGRTALPALALLLVPLLVAASPPTAAAPGAVGATSPRTAVPVHSDQPATDADEAASEPVPDAVRAEMEQHWTELGGAEGPLGSAAGEPFVIAGGARWDFTGGALFRADPPPDSPGVVSAVIGATLERYDAYDGPAGVLGYPLEDPQPLSGDPSVQRFEHGRIYSSTPTGAHVVRGAILQRYLAMGGAAGVLGLPVTDVVAAGVPASLRSNFEHGRIYSSTPTGTHEVTGAILARYLRLGGAAGRLGLPTTGELGTNVPGARRSHFQHGRIYWSRTTGAREVTGAILARYLHLGAAGGRLGLPTTGELDTSVPGARRSHFQHGRIYSSTTTGAHEVTGAILARYTALGGAGGRLGLPTTGQVGTAVAGARRNSFQHGYVYWSTRTGAHAVIGLVARRYAHLGGAGGRMGLPTSDDWAVTGGRRQHFQHGDLLSRYRASRAYIRLRFSAPARRITAADVPYTWRSGCPVSPAGLRMLRIVHRGWNGDDQVGRLVVRTGVVDQIRVVFRRAHASGFPIRRMVPADRWRGSDVQAMAHDSTNAFNCRNVTGNPYRLSQHSYGNAIDVNSFENPYVTSSNVYPAGSDTYLNRSWVRKGMIVSGGAVRRAFASLGWPWGARWAHPDYQHFSSNGG